LLVERDEFHFAIVADGRQDQEFVLGKRLLGDDRARKVVVAARPAGFLAEAADVRDEAGDLFGVERVFEARHQRRQPDARTAFRDRAFPVRIGLRLW
jgi:hypothetical protein